MEFRELTLSTLVLQEIGRAMGIPAESRDLALAGDVLLHHQPEVLAVTVLPDGTFGYYTERMMCSGEGEQFTAVLTILMYQTVEYRARCFWWMKGTPAKEVSLWTWLSNMEGVHDTWYQEQHKKGTIQ